MVVSKAHKHRLQEFEARLHMEKVAQEEVDARLKTIEAIVDNQLRKQNGNH